MNKHLHKYNLGLGRLIEAAIAGDVTKQAAFALVDSAVAELGALVDHAPRETIADWRLLDSMKLDETTKRNRFAVIDTVVNPIDPDPEMPAVSDKIKAEHATLGIWLGTLDNLKAQFEPTETP